MRNNEIVKVFKIKLIKEFFRMRELLQISEPTKNENLISVSTENMRKELEVLDYILNKIQFSEKEKIEFINQTLEKINFQTLKNPYLKKHEPVFTLTDLLAEFQISFSPHEINLKLQSFGIIEYSENGWKILDILELKKEKNEN